MRPRETRKPVYINKKLRDPEDQLEGRPAATNRNSRFIQAQPKHICKFVRIASLLLYKVYSDDPRFIVNSNEASRLNVANDKKFEYKSCSEHLSDLKHEQHVGRMNRAADEFSKDLRDPKHNKVDMIKQLEALVEVIKNSSDKVFSRARGELEKAGEG
jgi:hypothetical protein